MKNAQINKNCLKNIVNKIRLLFFKKNIGISRYKYRYTRNKVY